MAVGAVAKTQAASSSYAEAAAARQKQYEATARRLEESGRTINVGAAYYTEIEANEQKRTESNAEIEACDKKIQAVDELTGYLTTLKKASAALRNPTIITTSDLKKTATAQRSVEFSTSDGSPAKKFVEGHADADAVYGTFDLQITALAKKYSANFSNLTFTSAETSVVQAANGVDPTMFAAGVVKLNSVNTADDDRASPDPLTLVSMTLSEGDSLANIVQKGNAVSTRTGYEFSVLKISDTSYKLIITSAATGAKWNNTGFAADAAVVPGGLNSPKVGVDASFTINDELMTRSSNIISDALYGNALTLELVSPTVVDGDPITVTVKIVPDMLAVVNAVKEWKDAYNAFANFAAFMQETYPDQQENIGPKETAVLYNEFTLIRIEDSLMRATKDLARGIAEDAVYQTLGDLGLELKEVGRQEGDPETTAETSKQLELDEAKLSMCLIKDFTATANVLRFFSSVSNRNVAISSHNNDFDVFSFTVAVDPVTPSAQITYLNDLDDPVTEIAAYYSGNKTVATASDSRLYGVSFVYGPEVAGSTDFTLTQGVIDYIYNMVNDFLAHEGTVQTLRTKFVNERQQKIREAELVGERVDRDNENAKNKYSSANAKISQASYNKEMLKMLSERARKGD
jgi:flagellar hook-associated protein 2